MIVTLIAAYGQGRVLGSTKGGIPWDLPRDREHFRAYCAEKPLLLGRRTYEEMNGWFHEGQTALVLSENPSATPHHPETVFFSELTPALDHARSLAVPELVVCGGASIYRLCAAVADQAILTEIDAKIPGDLTFPELPSEQWQETAREHHPADPDHLHALDIITLARRPVSV